MPLEVSNSPTQLVSKTDKHQTSKKQISDAINGPSNIYEHENVQTMRVANSYEHEP